MKKIAIIFWALLATTGIEAQSLPNDRDIHSTNNIDTAINGPSFFFKEKWYTLQLVMHNQKMRYAYTVPMQQTKGPVYTESCINGTSCDDGNPCTVNDICINGVCSGMPKMCNDNNPCTTDFCDVGSGVCTFVFDDSRTCNDNNLCTINDYCLSGNCVGIPITCNDGNPCTNDICNPIVGCVSFPTSPRSHLVTSKMDNSAGSLREKINQSCTGDTIRFTVDTSFLSNPIIIPHKLYIIGQGQNSTFIDGQLTTRAFEIQNTKVLDLQELTIMNCSSTANGGAFYNLGAVNIKNTELKNNFEGSAKKAFSGNGNIIVLTPGILLIKE